MCLCLSGEGVCNTRCEAGDALIEMTSTDARGNGSASASASGRGIIGRTVTVRASS